MDYVYTNGAIAVKEQKLLGEKIYRLCEMTAEDAFRYLTESGFGAGAEAGSMYEVERLIQADERELDEFIRAYAPSEAEKAYFLAPRDFHNAKAIVKAEALKKDAGEMLAPEGLLSADKILSCVREEKYELLGRELGKAVKESVELLKENADGAKVGMIFERALYEYLLASCKRNKLLKKLVTGKIDRVNLLTAFRSQSVEDAEKNFIEGGTVSAKIFKKIFSDADGAERALAGGEISAFAAACFAAKREGAPFTAAEKMLASYEAEFFGARKFDLDKNLPFLYYVFRRRAEAENVRIVFVCLLAGMKEGDIKARLRTV